MVGREVEIMIEHQKIPVTKIISIACRDFMAFSGVHTFEFDSGINSIIGGNASGKSSLISMITQTLSPETSKRWNKQWYPNNNSDQSLLEIKFIADGKTHYLRRVMNGDNTTDLHLYIGEDGDEEREFFRDSQVVGYLTKLKPVFLLDSFATSRRDFFTWTNRHKDNADSMFVYREDLLDKLNVLLPITNQKVVKVVKSGNDLYAVYDDGQRVRLSSIASGNLRVVFVLAKILTMLATIEEDDLSRIVLIDEIEMGLDRSSMKGLNDAIKHIAAENDCQFMITSRFVNGRENPIRVNRTRIPSYYKTQANTIYQNPIITSHFQKFAKKVSWNWKP